MHNLSYITSNYTSLAAIRFSFIYFVTDFAAKNIDFPTSTLLIREKAL